MQKITLQSYGYPNAREMKANVLKVSAASILLSIRVGTETREVEFSPKSGRAKGREKEEKGFEIPKDVLSELLAEDEPAPPAKSSKRKQPEPEPEEDEDEEDDFEDEDSDDDEDEDEDESEDDEDSDDEEDEEDEDEDDLEEDDEDESDDEEDESDEDEDESDESDEYDEDEEDEEEDEDESDEEEDESDEEDEDESDEDESDDDEDFEEESEDEEEDEQSDTAAGVNEVLVRFVMENGKIIGCSLVHNEDDMPAATTKKTTTKKTVPAPVADTPVKRGPGRPRKTAEAPAAPVATQKAAPVKKVAAPGENGAKAGRAPSRGIPEPKANEVQINISDLMRNDLLGREKLRKYRELPNNETFRNMLTAAPAYNNAVWFNANKAMAKYLLEAIGRGFPTWEGRSGGGLKRGSKRIISTIIEKFPDLQKYAPADLLDEAPASVKPAVRKPVAKEGTRTKTVEPATTKRKVASAPAAPIRKKRTAR